MRGSLRIFAFLVFAVAACFFAFFSIQSRSIWLDEAYPILTALRPVAEIVPSTRQHDLSPPLYYFVLSLWIRLFGISEVATRSLSGIFYLLGLAGLYRLTADLFRDRQAAILSAVLYMLSPLAVRHAHSVRMYSLLGLEVTLSLVFFYRVFFRDAVPSQRTGTLLYVSVNVIGTLTHQWFLFSLAAQGLAYSLFVFPRRARAALAVYVLSLLPYTLLWLPATLTQVTSAALAWIAKPRFYAHFVGTFLDFFGGPRWGWVAFGAFALLVLARRTPPASWRPETKNRVLLSLFFVSVGSVGIPFLVSQYRPIFVTGRYTIIALPPFVAGLGYLLWQYGHRRLVVAGVGVLLVGSAFGLLARRLPDETASDRKTAEYLMARGQPGDVVIYNGLSTLAIEYYLLRHHRQQDFVALTFPRELAAHPGWMDVHSLLARQADFAGEAHDLAQGLARDVPPGRRVWVFDGGADSAITDLLTGQLEMHFRREGAHDLTGLTYTRILAFQKADLTPARVER